jgi:ABC-type multidrug transport system ATPase subunit
MPAMEKSCSHCQGANAPDARICHSCGRPFDDPPAPANGAGQPTVRWTGTPVRAKPGLRRTVNLDQLFARKSKILIGRAPECDLVLDHPMVSRQHAALERGPDGVLRLSDLGSMNGLTLGGQRLVGSAVLSENQQVGIGPFLFSLAGRSLQTMDNSVGLRLEARGLQKTVPLPTGGSRHLLDNINLVVEPGEFVSLLGPSGSGKSTLMDCLNGRRRATGGVVLANSVDFYQHFDNFRQSLGYVPQKDIVHTQLTVARALYYTAKLRLPTDTTRAELHSRMEEVIALMELGPHRDTLVGNLSGGQIKRVSLGAELLARPSMLYIDEATSGLDAGTEARMMKLFRELADEGKSLICITHNIDNVDRCHLIIVLARGKLMYYGPPSEAQTYFSVPKLSAIYDRLQERDVEIWEREFAGSSLYKEFVAKRLGANDAPSASPPSQTPAAESLREETPALSAPAPAASVALSTSSLDLQHDVTPPPRPQFTPWWHQFKVLTARYCELIWTDRRSLRLLMLQAPLVALFVLAGFVGKPYQQKIPVPHVSDDEYLALKMMLALRDGPKKADDPTDATDKEETASKVKFLIHHVEPDKGSVVVPHQELLRRIKEMRGRPKSKDVMDKTAITMELPGSDGEPQSVTRTVSQILDMQKAFEKSEMPQQLIEAHDVANTTNPRFTYILLFLMSIIVLWSGCNNAAKEIVKEEAIYGRERAVNLGILPYLASKFLVMTLLTMVQTLMLMGMVYGTLHLLHAIKPGFLEYADLPADEYMLAYLPQFGVLSLLAMGGVALGLLLSACVSSPDRANALLPYVLIPQIILGGGIMPIKHGVLQWLAWLMSPEYWAFRAIRLGETSLPNIMADNRMPYTDTLWLPCLVLMLESAALLALTAWFLKRKDEN